MRARVRVWRAVWCAPACACGARPRALLARCVVRARVRVG
ncbi:hypothetical protein chiPu_0030074, partial [Chiloscyllium punctatum]|nr:hypothetical protein [Chiloscyllium punctatum]